MYCGAGPGVVVVLVVMEPQYIVGVWLCHCIGCSGTVSKFSACSVAVANALAVVTKYPIYAIVSHMTSFSTFEACWSISVV